MKLLIALLVGLTMAPSGSAFGSACSVDGGHHLEGAVVNCAAVTHDVVIVAGNGQSGSCDPSRSNVILIVGNGNSVTCEGSR